MIARNIAISLALVAALSACSSGNNEAPGLPSVIASSMKSAIAAKRAGRADPVTVTPKMLAETKVAALQVNPERAGGSDFLRRIAQRRDSDGMVTEVWQSSDNAQIFLRNGVLVGTRGVGTDIISSDARATVRAVSTGTSGRGNRLYVLSDGDVTSQDVAFRCVTDNLGLQDIVIVNQVFETILLRESCIGGPSGDVTIRNDFWVHAQSGLVKKSRQWAGPASGYFEMILLKD